jgi:hypothetical protein
MAPAIQAPRAEISSQRRSPTDRLLLGLFVLLVLPAITAVLLDVEPVRVILLVFHGCVVAAFATATCQGDDDPVVLLSHGPNS